LEKCQNWNFELIFSFSNISTYFKPNNQIFEILSGFDNNWSYNWIGAILRQNTEFSAKSSPSLKSEKTLANLVYFWSTGCT
jgi:hypothetical protein